MILKYCYKCKNNVDASNFYKDKTRNDGLANKCKPCLDDDRKKYPRKESQHKYYMSPRGKYSSYKNGAKKRGIQFLLTYQQFLKFWNENCFYCDEPIDTVGLDRKDSNKGYTIGNVVSCCKDCNLFKGKMKSDNFISHAVAIASVHMGT